MSRPPHPQVYEPLRFFPVPKISNTLFALLFHSIVAAMSDLIQLDQVGYKIPNEDAVFQRERVSDLLKTRSLAFPGAQPVSFSRRHIRALQESDYYLCEKTDGIRCLLYLTFTLESNPETGDNFEKESVFLIDRKNDYYYITEAALHFPLPERPPDTYHRGTLVDGELVMDIEPDGRRVRRYLVFDCLALDGKPLLDRTLDKRIGYFDLNVLKPYNKLLDAFPEEREHQPFEVVMKKMEKAYGIRMLFDDVLPNLPHGNDGLVFTRRDTSYVTGTDQNIIKWKPPNENTIDFRLQIGLFPPLDDSEDEANVPAGGIDGHDYQPDYDACPAMSLLVFKGNGKNEHFDDLYVTDSEWTSMKSVNQMVDGRIIECHKDGQGRWRFKREKDGTPRFRDDKTEANHISTVNSVLQSIEDAVSQEDLLSHDNAIKRKWKEREELMRKRMMEEEKLRRDAEARKRAAAA